jgi:hypothetical protein
MTNQTAVIPSEVEESRSESFKVIPRDLPTSLRMTVVRGAVHHSLGFRASQAPRILETSGKLSIRLRI